MRETTFDIVELMILVLNKFQNLLTVMIQLKYLHLF